MKKFIQENNNASIDEKSCHNDHEDGDDDYCEDEECDDGDDCHISRLNAICKKEGDYPWVEKCCPFNGSIETATCDGTDRNNDQITYMGADVCVNENGDQIPFY